MKIVKKIIKYIFILFGVLIVAAIVLPVLFKDEIVAKVKEVANDSVDAKVDFGEFDLSLISSFPNFEFEIGDISVINKAPFKGDTLVHIGLIDLELDLMSVIGGEYVVSSLIIDDITANAKILKDGKANWDIVIEEGDSTYIEGEEHVHLEDLDAEDASEFVTGLESFSITNVNVSYVDLQSEMVAIIKGFNQSGSLHMVNDSTEIDVKTGIDAITFDMEGERLADKVKFESEIVVFSDLATAAFNFHENEFKINDLKLGVNGHLEMPDDMNFDLSLSAKDNKFKDLISLIPTIHMQDFKETGSEISGEFSLAAHLLGVMDDENIPGFDVDFHINDGLIHYPDLPESLKDINMDLSIDNKDGIIDHTVVNLSKFHMMLAGNPINFNFFVTNVESDPNMKGEVHSKIQLEKLSKAIPMEVGEEYQGGINANFKFGGKLSSIENEQYEDFNAEGSVIFDNLLYKSTDLPTTLIKTGYLNFSPHYFEVSNFDMKLGKSDLTANGRVDNILPYVFHDSTIVGTFNINSNFFDLNELSAEDSTAVVEGEDEVSAAIHNAEISTDSTYEEPTEVFEVPNNIDFVLNSSFKKIDFEDMPIDDFKGQIKLKNGIAHFHEASMNVYNGTITIDGDYNTQDMAHPKTSLDLTVDDMEIKEAYLAFNPVKKMVPMAKNANGEFHTEFKFETELDDTLAPVYKTMNGEGFLSTTNLGFSETNGWKKLVNAIGLKNEKFDKVKAEDIKIEYQFIDGKLKTQPFKLNLGKIKGEVSGYTTFDNNINYKYALKIPREELGGAVDGAAGLAESFASKNGIDISVGDYINVDVLVTGTVDNPNYKVVPAGTSSEEGSIKDQAKVIVKEKIDEAKEKVKAEVDKVKEKASEEADRLKKEAEDKAKAEKERLKKEAEEKAKAEAEKAKAKAKEETKKKAGGLLKKGLGI